MTYKVIWSSPYNVWPRSASARTPLKSHIGHSLWFFQHAGWHLQTRACSAHNHFFFNSRQATDEDATEVSTVLFTGRILHLWSLWRSSLLVKLPIMSNAVRYIACKLLDRFWHKFWIQIVPLIWSRTKTQAGGTCRRGCFLLLGTWFHGTGS
jgi:hypothetical protein